MYMDAAAVVMTWEGGGQYIRDMGWSGQIPDEKVVYVGNGVDLETFDRNVAEYQFQDEDLTEKNTFKVVYTGSVRFVNRIDMLVEAAKQIEQRGNPYNVRILIWGDGDKKDEIKKEIMKSNLSIIKIKDSVAKQYIPSILSKGDCCILHDASNALDKYGQSQNKFYEYLASGRPVLMTYTVGYSVIDKYKCGMMLEEQSVGNIADAIEKMAAMSIEQRMELSKNARIAADNYNFRILTQKVISVIEQV